MDSNLVSNCGAAKVISRRRMRQRLKRWRLLLILPRFNYLWKTNIKKGYFGKEDKGDKGKKVAASTHLAWVKLSLEKL